MFVTENLLQNEGFASHPVPRGRRSGGNREAEKAMAQTPPEAGEPPTPTPPVLPASPLSLSAPWQLAGQANASPPLEFPVAGTRGNGPFGTIYRNKVTAAISPESS